MSAGKAILQPQNDSDDAAVSRLRLTLARAASQRLGCDLVKIIRGSLDPRIAIDDVHDVDEVAAQAVQLGPAALTISDTRNSVLDELEAVLKDRREGARGHGMLSSDTDGL